MPHRGRWRQHGQLAFFPCRRLRHLAQQMHLFAFCFAACRLRQPVIEHGLSAGRVRLTAQVKQRVHHVSQVRIGSRGGGGNESRTGRGGVRVRQPDQDVLIEEKSH